MKIIRKIIKWTLIVFFASSLGAVVLYKFVPVYVTPLMLMRACEAIGKGETPRIEKTWVPIEEISPKMIQAVVASEDNFFRGHHGFSRKGIEYAMKQNKKGKKLRGGSTISQQTAKNVFLTPHRNFVRKGFEVYFTLLIEFVWGKERIMEVYLNVIEMGDGIYGAEAAAAHYFGVSAKQLSSAQAALIAVSLPSPRRFNPAHPSAYLSSRQALILRLMPKVGPQKFDGESLAKARENYKKYEEKRQRQAARHKGK